MQPGSGQTSPRGSGLFSHVVVKTQFLKYVLKTCLCRDWDFIHCSTDSPKEATSVTEYVEKAQHDTKGDNQQHLEDKCRPHQSRNAPPDYRVHMRKIRR